MADIILTQSEADSLLAMEKHRVGEERYEFPLYGNKLVVPLQAPDKRETFLLDIKRGRLNLLKTTFQNRGRIVIVLARLDLNGSPHQNPDGSELPCPHLHLYREGYGAKCAIPVDTAKFPNLSDIFLTLNDFMAFCNVTEPPFIQGGLFS